MGSTTIGKQANTPNASSAKKNAAVSNADSDFMRLGARRKKPTEIAAGSASDFPFPDRCLGGVAVAFARNHANVQGGILGTKCALGKRYFNARGVEGALYLKEHCGLQL